MREPAGGILWCDGAECGPDGGAVSLERPRLGTPKERLDLREGFLDRVEVRRVGRQVPELRPTGFDRLTGTVAEVDREVVGDDDLVWLQGGASRWVT
jgi:hypothetical protein